MPKMPWIGPELGDVALNAEEMERRVEQDARQQFEPERDREQEAQHVAEGARGLQRVADVADDDRQEGERGQRDPAPERAAGSELQNTHSDRPADEQEQSRWHSRTSEISRRRATSTPIPMTHSDTTIVT